MQEQQRKPGRPKGYPKTGGRKLGTPSKPTADIKRLSQGYGAELIETLMKIARSAESDAARVAAIKEVLDRGYGKATQPIAGDEDGAPIKQAVYIVTGVPRD
jgi:hypothetical protein